MIEAKTGIGDRAEGLNFLPLAVELAPTAIAVLKGFDLTVVFANRAYRENFGGGRREIAGMKLSEIVPQLGEDAWKNLRDTLESGIPFTDHEYPINPPGHLPRYWDVSLVPFGDSGSAAYLLVNAQDVTERVQARRQLEKLRSEADARSRQAESAEKASQHSEMGLIQLADMLPSIVWTSDADGRLTYVNQTWRDYTGNSAAVPQLEDVRSYVHPDDMDRLWDQMARYRRQGDQLEHQVRIRHHGGEYRWMLMRSLPQRDEQGNIIRHIGTAVDIGTQKHIESQLQTSLQQKEILLQEVNHRVKNSLQLVSSLLAAQAMQIDDEDAKRAFADSCERIAAVASIHERLYIADSIDNRVEFSAYLENFVAQWGLASGSLTRKPRWRVTADRAVLPLDQAVMLALVANELVTNAQKHDGNGGQVTFTYENGRYRLAVANRQAALPENFDIENSNGLGMRILTALAKQLGGRLEWQTPPEGGAVFSVSFPA